MTRQTISSKRPLCLSAIAIILVLALGAMPAFAQRATLTILTVNDVYEIAPVQGRGGLAELMTLLKAERATATHHLTTINGDFLSPSLMSALLKGAQMVDLFNTLGVDVVVFGNHEFDFGPELTQQRMSESTFVWLGTNVLGPDGTPFGGALATLTRQVGPLTVGLFGLLTPETARLSSPGPGVTFAPVIPAAKTAVETLRKAGADVIIALTHLTIAEDRELAHQVPGIHLILGGHDHDPITWYEGSTLVHKSGYDAHYLGRIDVVMEKTTTAQGPRVTVVPSWRMIANQGVTPAPEVAAKVAEYTAKLDSELAQPLGQSQTALDSQRGEVRTRETTMGNLVADALREALHADAALVNGGGIRGDRLYEAGTTLTRRDILRELPFGNIGVLLKVSGSDLLAALEHGVSQVEAKAGRFPQVSGLRVVYDPHQPAGSRVVEATINGVPIDLATGYRVATVDYLFKGGDGYVSLTRGQPLVDTSGGILLATIVMQHIATRGTVAPTIEGRIVARGK
jgi:2',3'-cyclic-nucleotide 2'-phosphodiesterase (5'-nucleotidase family)